MGSFSQICAVSGLPITCGDKVAFFYMEKHRWETYYDYIPQSWPIISQYDDYGSVDDAPDKDDYDRPKAMIHWDIWKNAEKYWHRENMPCTDDWFDVKNLVKTAEAEIKVFREIGMDEYKNWTLSDGMYWQLMRNSHHHDFRHTFMKMCDSKELLPHRAALTEEQRNGSCFLDRSAFMEVILQKIINKDWKKKDQIILNKVVSLIGGQMLLGHYLLPSNELYVEQCPEYDQRIEIMERHLELAKKLKRRRY